MVALHGILVQVSQLVLCRLSLSVGKQTLRRGTPQLEFITSGDARPFENKDFMPSVSPTLANWKTSELSATIWGNFKENWGLLQCVITSRQKYRATSHVGKWYIMRVGVLKLRAQNFSVHPSRSDGKL